MAGGWHITVAKADFVEAVGVARTRATLHSKGGINVERDLTLAACEGGLSVRSSFAAMDIDGEGEWASPVMVYAAAIRQVAPKLPGPTIVLCYEPGKLWAGEGHRPHRWRSIAASRHLWGPFWGPFVKMLRNKLL